MTRVSPPELDRLLPGPHASMSVTMAPRRRSASAVHPPNAPAPTTTTFTAYGRKSCPDDIRNRRSHFWRRGDGIGGVRTLCGRRTRSLTRRERRIYRIASNGMPLALGMAGRLNEQDYWRSRRRGDRDSAPRDHGVEDNDARRTGRAGIGVTAVTRRGGRRRSVAGVAPRPFVIVFGCPRPS